MRNGPWPDGDASPMSRSNASRSAPVSSWARHSSETAALRIRLTTKPGASAERIGALRIAWAKVAVAWAVSVDVSSPSTTSTRRLTVAGKKKCRPTTLSGRIVACPISVMESAEVLEARMAWPGVASSSSENTACLSSICSGTASMTRSTSPKSA